MKELDRVGELVEEIVVNVVMNEGVDNVEGWELVEENVDNCNGREWWAC